MRDVALLLRLLAGHDPRDPHSLAEPVPAYPDSPREDLRGVRIGLPSTVFWEDLDPQVEAVSRSGLDRLVARGAELVEVPVPARTADVLAVPGTYGDTMGPEALEHHADWLVERGHLYGDAVLHRFSQARETTPERYAQAQRDRAVWAQGWRDVFAEHRLDALAHPTIPEPPAVVPEDGRGAGPTIALAKAWSVTGFPALSVPAGLDDRRLPVGLQLAGLPEQEAALVGLGITLDEDVQLWRTSP
jgi:aspartyl-tRNA(Asn)/glutamyl-tRNA(Gln) amidotransferase subunit A